MGQGLYTMLGYGVIADDDQIYGEDEARHHSIVDHEISQHLETPYEAEPAFLVLRLAVDEGFLQDWWGLPDLPHEALGGTVEKRKAKQISVAEAKFPPQLKHAVKKARERWAAVAEAFRQHGISLPEAGFILVNDWD